MPHAMIVVGLANGDEGKGSVVDHLVRRHGIRRVVRFNGGAQAMHHVVNDGVVHGFSQFGAGTLAGAQTLLSRFMLFEPLAFCSEAYTLSGLGIPDPYSLVTVSARAPIITSANILANRILEIHRGAARHGSCGLGIGLTQGDVEEIGEQAVYAGDLDKAARLREKLAFNLQRRLDTVCEITDEETHELRNRLAAIDIQDLTAFYGEFAQRIKIVPEEQILQIIACEDTVFEGAQGVLLDQTFGFFPYVTRSTTTFQNAHALLKEAGFEGETTRIGLLRAYSTRHGAGPLLTETDELRIEPCHNGPNPWQGEFRIGWLDAVTARYALKVVGGVDILGLTNLDRLIGLDSIKTAVAYERDDWLPEGNIPSVSAQRESAPRTTALLHARPVYEKLPTVENNSPELMFRYADAVSERIGHSINLLSFRPDHRKAYRDML